MHACNMNNMTVLYPSDPSMDHGAIARDTSVPYVTYRSCAPQPAFYGHHRALPGSFACLGVRLNSGPGDIDILGAK